jgi:hypothetical protein
MIISMLSFLLKNIDIGDPLIAVGWISLLTDALHTDNSSEQLILLQDEEKNGSNKLLDECLLYNINALVTLDFKGQILLLFH